MSKCKVDAQYSDWKAVEKIDGNTFIFERVSELFGLKQTATFRYYDGKKIRISDIKKEKIVR